MQHTEFQTALERLQALPDETKSNLGPKLNRYLNKLDDLRSALTAGLESGPAKSAGDVFDRLETKYRDIEEDPGQ
jgi:hypothetical protein